MNSPFSGRLLDGGVKRGMWEEVFTKRSDCVLYTIELMCYIWTWHIGASIVCFVCSIEKGNNSPA
jgi:hypothetical protein